MKQCDECGRAIDCFENLNAYFELLLCDACYAEAKNNDRINARGEK